MTYHSGYADVPEDIKYWARNSLLFDIDRQSIYAQTYEFGYVGVRSEYQNYDDANSYKYLITYIYKDIGGTGELVFTYTKVSDDEEDAIGGVDAGDVTLLGLTPTVRVLTNIKQNSIGRLSYTYVDINTFHDSTGSSTLNTSDPSTIVTNVRLSQDGVMSYTFSTLETNVSSYAVDGLEHTGIEVWDDANHTTSHEIEAINVLRNYTNELINKGIPVLTGVNMRNDGLTTTLSYSYSLIFADRNHHYEVGNSEAIVLTKEGHQVITNIYLNNEGGLSYQYGNLVVNNSQYAESLSYLTYVEGNVGTYSYVMTYLFLDSTSTVPENQVTMHLVSLAMKPEDGTKAADTTITYNDKLNVLTGISQTGDGKVTYTYSLLNTIHTQMSDFVPQYNQLITSVNLTEDGLFTFTYTDNTVEVGTANSSNVQTHTNNLTEVPYTTTEGLAVLTGIKESKDGKISYTYTNIFTDPVNHYTYHDLSITQQTLVTNENFVYALTGISTSNGNASAHTISYEFAEVPNKRYVDALLQANDVFRFCGVVTPAAIANGAIRLSHIALPGPGHSDPDLSTGAIYKVNTVGYIGTEYVSPGDSIYSYMDSADATTATGWQVINENVHLITLDPTLAYNSATGTPTATEKKQVLTNVHLNDEGSLSYTYQVLMVDKVSTQNNISLSAKQAYTPLNILRKSGNVKGIKVITGIDIEQDAFTTKISYTYTDIYANWDHHSCNNNNKTEAEPQTFSQTYTNIITGVNISSSGVLSYTYTPFNVSDSEHSDFAGGLDSIVKSGDDEGIIYNLTLSDPEHVLTYHKVNVSGSATYDFIRSYTQAATGKVTVSGYYFGNIKDTSTKYISNGSYDFLTNVHIDSNGYVSYTSTNVTITDTYVYHQKTTATSRIDLTGTKNSSESRTYSYFTDHAYIYVDSTAANSYQHTTNQRIEYDLRVGRHTYIGNANDDYLYLNGKYIKLDNTDGLVSVIGLSKLWGTIS